MEDWGFEREREKEVRFTVCVDSREEVPPFCFSKCVWCVLHCLLEIFLWFCLPLFIWFVFWARLEEKIGWWVDDLWFERGDEGRGKRRRLRDRHMIVVIVFL